MAEGLLALYEATGEVLALEGAAELGRHLLRHFQDPDSGALYQVSAEARDLPLRRESWVDSAEPAGAGVALQVLVRLHALGTKGVEHALLEKSFGAASRAWGSTPAMAPGALVSLLGWEGPPWTIVISGPDAASRAPLAQVARQSWGPLRLVAETGEELHDYAAFTHKQAAGPRAWICEGAACRLPLREPEALAAALLTPTRGQPLR